METQPQVFPGTRKGRGACPGGEDKGLWKQIRLVLPPVLWVRDPHWAAALQRLGFPCGSVGKESACNAGDLVLIPGLGRSPGEGTGTHSSILAWKSPWGHKGLDTME